MLFRPLAAAFLVLLISSQTALCGAWTLAEGDGQWIVTTGRKAKPIGAWAGRLAKRDKTSVFVFVEYGLTDRLTLGAKGSADWISTDNQFDLRAGGHLRYRLWQGGAGDVFSIQFGAAAPIRAQIDPALVPTGGNVAEFGASLLYGRGWISDWGNTFVSLEAGYRRRHGLPDELRVEGTVGHALSPRLMGLFATYVTHPLDGVGDPSLKLAPSAAWTLWPSLGPNDKKSAEIRHPRTIQLSLSYDVLKADEGLGFYVSVWNRF